MKERITAWIDAHEEEMLACLAELIEVPSIDSPTAHPGKERLPRKYSSVLLFFLAK